MDRGRWKSGKVYQKEGDKGIMQDISVIIMTLNEERHIRRALTNSKKFAKEIFVVDSYSSDNTIKIAQQMGAVVFQHEWKSYSNQFAWAINNLPIKTEWVWRQDADEYLTEELIEELDDVLPKNDGTINGYTAQCLRKFMGREIKHGIVPLILLRLFRFGHAYIEDKLMDEHLVLNDGTIYDLKNAFYDDSLMTLTEWTNKHNSYATKEALDILLNEYSLTDNRPITIMGQHTANVRCKKLKYLRLPLFWRAFAFFVYRYFFKLGFLDGKEGFLWHFLQGFWYRTLADAKIFEIKKRFGFDDAKIKVWLLQNKPGTGW